MLPSGFFRFRTHCPSSVALSSASRTVASEEQHVSSATLTTCTAKAARILCFWFLLLHLSVAVLFSSSHAHDLFLVTFSHGSRPRRRFVHTAGGSVYGSSTPIPHPFKSGELVRATGRDPHPQRGRRRTANLANLRSLSESTHSGAVQAPKSPIRSPQHPTRTWSLQASLHRCCKVLTKTGASHGGRPTAGAATRGSRSPRQEPSANATPLGGGG